MELEDLNRKEVDAFLKKLEGLKGMLQTTLSVRRVVLNGELYITNNELCNLLHISKRTLQEYRDAGIIPFIKLPGKILYKESDVLKLLEKHYYVDPYLYEK